MRFAGKIANLVWKDLLMEFRAKNVLSSMFIFSFLVITVFVFAFAFTPDPDTVKVVFPGLLWLAFSFAGVLGLNRTFAAEKEERCLWGLMLAPVDRTAIYFGKAAGNLLFMGVVEVMSLPLFFVLFNVPAGGPPLALLGVLFLGTLGFVAVGTFLAGLAANTRAGEILLPLIILPIIVPVLIAAVKSTSIVLAGIPPDMTAELWRWLRLMAVYDVIFLAVPFMLFEYVLEV